MGTVQNLGKNLFASYVAAGISSFSEQGFLTHQTTQQALFEVLIDFYTQIISGAKHEKIAEILKDAILKIDVYASNIERGANENTQITE